VKPKTPDDSQTNAGRANGKPVAIVQCSIPQGNGGNWAATLGWISEQMMIRAEQAEQLTKSGRSVGIYLGCMLGGSSGSVVTNVVMRLLNNNNLVPGAHPEKLFSAADTRTIARAVRYVAMAADLNLRELAVFFAQVAGNNVVSLANKSTLIDKIKSIFGQNEPKWWNGQQVDGNMMLIDFATLLHLAENLTSQMVNEPVEKILNGELLKAASSRKISKMTDFALFDHPQQLTSATAEKNNLETILEKQSEHIGKTADDFIAKHFALGQYRARYFTNVFRDGNKDYPLTVTLDRPLAQGFCTITMAAVGLKSNELSLERAPDYKALRPVVFCSGNMVRTLLKSNLYRRHLRESNPFASRFVLASVRASRGSMSPSIREPGMMSEVIGEADKGVLEVEELYAPDIDKKINGELTFQPYTIAALAKENGGVKPTLGIAGGFPDRRITAWMISYFFIDKMDELKRNGYEVVGRLGLFGKPDNRSIDKFDTSSIRTIFSANPQAAEANVKDWFAFQDAFCNTFEPAFASSGGKISTVAFNWDLTKLPAAQKGASRLILVKGANAARSQLGFYEASAFRGFVFDPNAETDHVPKLNQGYPCKP
jgi:hypothetical protein